MKASTIDKYTKQLEQWSRELQQLEKKGRAIATREHEQTRRSNESSSAPIGEEEPSSDEDLSDKEMYEVAWQRSVINPNKHYFETLIQYTVCEVTIYDILLLSSRLVRRFVL